ncbi:MAG: hypothetical protein AAB770_00580 [Patescibacteria group bacterium]
MRTQLLNALKVSALAVVLSFGLSYALAWTTAPSANPPALNAEEPINEGPTAQTKRGALTIGSATSSATLTIAGPIGSTNDVCTSVTGSAVCLSSVNATTTPAGGFLIYAIHTFQDCILAGGTLSPIGGNKNTCNIPSTIPSGWTQYQNWSETQNVYCQDTNEPVGGWVYPPPTRTPCNTGSHTFSNTPTESCTATSEEPLVCDIYGNCTGGNVTSTTCYATITRVLAY